MKCPGLGGGGLLQSPLPECTDDSGLALELETGQPDTAAMNLQGGGGCSHVGPTPLWPILVLWLLRALGPAVAWGADAQLLQTLDGGRFVGVQTVDAEPRASLRVAVFGQHVASPLVLASPDTRHPVVPTLQTAELGASWGIRRGFRVGLTLPYHWARQPDGELERGHGDTSVWLAMALPGTGGLGFRVAYDAPPRQPVPWLSAGALSYAFSRDHQILGGMLGWRVGMRIQRKEEFAGVTVGNRVDGAFGYRRDFGLLGLTAEILGSAPLGVPRSLRDLPVEALTSVHLDLTPGVGLVLAGSAGLTTGFGAPSHRVTGGVVTRGHAPRDRDGDGIRDLFDRCRREPEDPDGFRDRDGCPDLDNDRDTIPDGEDLCPLRAEVFNGIDDRDGCPDAMGRWTLRVHGPEVYTVHDGDGEQHLLGGEVYTIEREPGHVSARVRAEGFVSARVEALVEDGIHTTTDLTLEPLILGTLEVHLHSETGGALAGSLHVRGRTEAVSDGLWQSEERVGAIRVEAEAPGHEPAEVQAEVRPDETTRITLTLRPSAVYAEGPHLRLGEATRFELDSARPTEDSARGLDSLAAWLIAHPEVRLVRVEGHADSVGGSAYNYALSVRRAERVTQALVERGVERERLTAVGSGEALSWAGPERRVGFTILVQDDL